MRREPAWFIIQSGEHEGRLHLSGWIGSAIAEAPGMKYRHGPAQGQPRPYRAVSSCPLCFAMVDAEDHDNPTFDNTWAHEKWHHDSGQFPVPPDLLERGSWSPLAQGRLA